MLQKIINWFFGFVYFSADGQFPERFFNICASKNRDIWNIRRKGGKYYAYTKSNEYKNLRSAAKASKVKLKIQSKTGLPFFLKHNRKRYGMFAGIAIFIAMLWFLSGFIWDIQIKGNANIPHDEIYSILEQNGIKKGCPQSQDFSGISQKIMLQNNKIAWMSISLIGTTAYVDISETAEKSKGDINSPCDIVASCDGMIKSMTVTNGNALVKVGDAVVKGDTLVSGTVQYPEGSTVFKHASAQITALTEHTLSISVPFKNEATVPTGEIFNRYVLHFFHINLPLYFTDIDEPFTKETFDSNITFGDAVLPIGLTHTRYIKMNNTVNELSSEEALSLGKEKLNKIFREKSPNTKILKCEYTSAKFDDHIDVKCVFFCEESIVFKKKLLIF